MKKMPKSKNGPRSNFSFLPFELRFRVIGMIQDGCTASAIASDPEVAKAYSAMGSAFNRATMTRIKKSAEFKVLAAKRAARKAAEYDDQLTAAMIREAGSLDNIADQAKVTLMKALSDLSDLSDMSDESRIKALRSLAQSVAALTNPAKDNRIAELLRKLRDKEAEIDELKAELAESEVRHREEIFRLTAKDNTVADPSKVADELSHILGVKK